MTPYKALENIKAHWRARSGVRQGQKPESSSSDTGSRWHGLKLECPLSAVKRTCRFALQMSQRVKLPCRIVD
jgi:hypothetical protein